MSSEENVRLFSSISFSLRSLVKAAQTPRIHIEKRALVYVYARTYVRVSVGMYGKAVDSSLSVNRANYESQS